MVTRAEAEARAEGEASAIAEEATRQQQPLSHQAPGASELVSADADETELERLGRRQAELLQVQEAQEAELQAGERSLSSVLFCLAV